MPLNSFRPRTTNKLLIRRFYGHLSVPLRKICNTISFHLLRLFSVWWVLFLPIFFLYKNYSKEFGIWYRGHMITSFKFMWQMKCSSHSEKQYHTHDFPFEWKQKKRKWNTIKRNKEYGLIKIAQMSNYNWSCIALKCEEKLCLFNDFLDKSTISHVESVLVFARNFSPSKSRKKKPPSDICKFSSDCRYSSWFEWFEI